MKDKNFENEVFPSILTELGKAKFHYTKTRRDRNQVDIRGREVWVMTKKSKPNYQMIPCHFFEKTWELLCEKNSVTQNELSKEHNIKRSAFILIAFDLLDFVEYDGAKNALKLKCRVNSGMERTVNRTWKDVNNPESIWKAIRRCDEMGRDNFLTYYGYGMATKYALMANGKRYDPKAILGVAYGYEFNCEHLPPHKVKKAKERQNKFLKLGFDVIKFRD